MKDIRAELGNVDRKDAVERAKNSAALSAALEMSRPRNWWGTGIPPMRLLKIAHDEGIPVAWLPRADLLVELDSAATREARLAVLLARRNQVLEDCDALVEECDDPWVGDERTLVQRALAAFRAGHHEAAMALAVSIGEPLALWASTPRVKVISSEADRAAWEERRKTSKYLWVAQEINNLPSAVHHDDVLRNALIAPIVGFFRPFRIERGDSVPAGLSRHVVAHRATVAHLSQDNALLAVMLVTSLLREMQSWSEEVRFMDNPGD